MRRARRLLVSFVSVTLAASVGLAPSASAQGDCTLLTVAQVEAALGTTGTTSQRSGSFCTFGTDTESVYIVIQPVLGPRLPAGAVRRRDRHHGRLGRLPLSPRPDAASSPSCPARSWASATTVGSPGGGRSDPHGPARAGDPAGASRPQPRGRGAPVGDVARDHRRPAHDPAVVRWRPAGGLHGPDRGPGDRAQRGARGPGQDGRRHPVGGQGDRRPRQHRFRWSRCSSRGPTQRSSWSRCSVPSHRQTRPRPRSRPPRSTADPRRHRAGRPGHGDGHAVRGRAARGDRARGELESVFARLP